MAQGLYAARKERTMIAGENVQLAREMYGAYESGERGFGWNL